jgi:hypothetical protein
MVDLYSVIAVHGFDLVNARYQGIAVFETRAPFELCFVYLGLDVFISFGPDFQIIGKDSTGCLASYSFPSFEVGVCWHATIKFAPYVITNLNLPVRPPDDTSAVWVAQFLHNRHFAFVDPSFYRPFHFLVTTGFGMTTL